MMKPIQHGRWFCLGMCLLLLGALARAEDQDNPYQSIVERNAFNLKPIPTASAESTAPPPAPLAKVVLTGITSIFGPASKRALLEIEDTDGKTKNVRKPILQEGDRDGAIEILAIDLANSTVRIRNGTVETNLALKAPEIAAATPPPVTPGVPMPGRTAIPGMGMPRVPTIPTPGMVPTPTIIPKPGSAGYSGYGGTTPSSTGTGYTPSTVTPGASGYRAPFPYRTPTPSYVVPPLPR